MIMNGFYLTLGIVVAFAKVCIWWLAAGILYEAYKYAKYKVDTMDQE